MEKPKIDLVQESVYNIDVDYKVINNAYKAIKDFYEKYRTNPDYLIVGSLVFVSIAHYFMKNYYMAFDDITSFENVPMILDPTAKVDSAIAVFASPSKVLKCQVTPDEIIKPVDQS